MYALLLILTLAVSVSGVHAQSSCPPAVTPPTPSQVQDALRNARDRGALWRFEKDGRHGYLYGTIHVGKLEWAIPGRLVGQALRDAETIAIEADPSDPALSAGMTAPPKPHEAPVLPAPLMDRLRAQAVKVCAPWERLATMPPMMILATLMMHDARWQGLHAEYGSEVTLLGFARATGKEIAALETVAAQRSALTGSPPAEQLAVIEEGLAALENGSVREQLSVVANTWVSGDLDALGRFLAGRPSAERASLERAVVGRNPAMAARIDELHRGGRRIFVAAGFFHMVGDGGLPKLLADRGFKVERVGLDARP